jgi:hypothetical protein
MHVYKGKLVPPPVVGSDLDKPISGSLFILGSNIFFMFGGNMELVLFLARSAYLATMGVGTMFLIMAGLQFIPLIRRPWQILVILALLGYLYLAYPAIIFDFGAWIVNLPTLDTVAISLWDALLAIIMWPAVVVMVFFVAITEIQLPATQPSHDLHPISP